MMFSSKNRFEDRSQNPIEEVALNDNYDNYEPQHQYHEPSEEVMKQLRVPNNSVYEDRPRDMPASTKRKPVPEASTGKKSSPISKLDAAKRVGMAVFSHMKRSEMPWTQWYCCAVVDGKTGERVCIHSFEMGA
jgi:hypothetical protein